MAVPLRLALAAVLLLLLLALQLPFLPWHDPLHRQLLDLGPAMRQLLALTLVGALGLAIPPPGRAVRPADHARPEQARSMLLVGIGSLFLIEPLLHLLLLAWAAQQPGASLLSLVLPPQAPTTDLLLLHLPLAVLLPAVIEEWTFRGRLFGLLRRGWGPGHACSLSTLLFAAVHATPVAVLVAVPIGLLLALLRLAGMPLRTCMIVHGVHNLLFLSVTGLAAIPLLPLLLVVCGAWLLALGLAWRWFVQPRQQRRILLTSCLVMLLALWLLPEHRRLQEELWLRAATLQLAHPSLDLTTACRRVTQRQHGQVLDDHRRGRLAKRLIEGPWEVPPERLAPLLAVLEPTLLMRHAERSPDVAGSMMGGLLDCGLTRPPLRSAVHDLAGAHPSAMRALIIDRWRILPHWLQAESDHELLVHAVATVHHRERQLLLARIGGLYGHRVALACVLDLPAAAIGPKDRLWLFRHEHDPLGLLQERWGSDPERSAAWGLSRPGGR